METLGDKQVTKMSNNSSKQYFCKDCDYMCSKKYNLDRHMMSSKHSMVTKQKQTDEQNEQNEQKNSLNKLSCKICNKIYTSRNGLWKHLQKCKPSDVCVVDKNKDDEIQELKVFMNYLMKENSEMKNMVMKVLENGTMNNSHNTNSHNKTFNLNLFLNETCKDAMNIMDFVDSIKLQVTDLERVGEVGYVEGISDIIVSNLNKLDITQRPIHCTDKKRETMYVKDAGKWEKDESTTVIRRAIRKVTHNNQRLLPQFKEKYPDYHNSYSSHSDKVTKVIIETMVNNVPDKEEKIIRNIAKSVVLDKTHSL